MKDPELRQSVAKDERKLPYETPKLRSFGGMKEFTKTVSNTSLNGDGGSDPFHKTA